MENFDMDSFINQLSAGNNALAGAIGAYAMRPQKSSVSSRTETRPNEYADMLARRNQIGTARGALAEALKQRENFVPMLGAALAQTPQPQGYGSWLGAGLAGLGQGLGLRTNLAVDRAMKDYETSRNDLADALMYDKAMGDTQTQTQTIGYDNMPYTQKEKNIQAGNNLNEQSAKWETAADSLADVYRTIANNELLFSNLAPVYQDADSRLLKEGVQTQGIERLGHNEFEYLNSIMPKGFTTAINTAAEQKLMRPYTTQFSEGTGTAKLAAISNMMGSIYDAYAAEARKQGIKMPISRQEYINSRLSGGREYNPAFFGGKSTQMYKQEKPKGLVVGTVINGYRYKGGDTRNQQNWEKI